jgi:uncharacterized protein with GYD domain
MMARYLFQFAYTPESWAAQLQNPQDRVAQVSPFVERLGGRFEWVYYAFGDHDIVGVVELPDNVSAAAFSMAISAGGAAKAIKTPPLMTIAEGIEAMGKGAAAGYRPPAR